MNYHLIEMANGILAVMFSWMFLYGSLHVKRCYDYARREPLHGSPKFYRAIIHLYRNNKPEIALLFIVGCITLRTWLLWYLRFVDNRNFRGWKILTDEGTGIVVLLTFGVALGVMCWIRVIAPYRYRNRVIWILMVLAAIAFGVGSAIYPEW